MAYINCEDLVLGYEGTMVAEHIRFSVNQGDYLCIVGENGAGKSTLMKIILPSLIYILFSSVPDVLFMEKSKSVLPRKICAAWIYGI